MIFCSFEVLMTEFYQKVSSKMEVDDSNDDDQFLPENETQEEGEEMNISPALRALMAKYAHHFHHTSILLTTCRVDKPSKPGYLDDEVEPTCTKIYYASRTHSQLAQVLPELRRLTLKLEVSSHHPQATTPIEIVNRKRGVDGLDNDDVEDPPLSYSRSVSLGSRKQLCINDELRARTQDLDEGCRELLAGALNVPCQVCRYQWIHSFRKRR